MGGDKGGGSSFRAYYGTIAGVVCAGPVDELVALIVDGATVWPVSKPSAPNWADGVLDLPTTASATVTRGGTSYYALEFLTPHKLRPGDKFTVTGFTTTPGMNRPTETVVAAVPNDYRIQYAVGSLITPVAWGANTEGLLTHAIHYTVGAIVRAFGKYWICILDHYSAPDKTPTNATYWTRYGVLRSLSSNPYAFTVPNYGQAYFYWGTSDQVLDDVNEVVLSRGGHPAYRNQAVLVLKSFLFGTERQAAPNIEVVVRRAPQQGVVTGASAELDGDCQANPIAAGIEALTNPIFGSGHSEAIFDATTAQDAADSLAAVSDQAYLSPVISSGVTARGFVADLLAYYDGWMRFNSAGKIESGRFLHNEAPPAFTAATTINYHDLVEEISWDTDGWSQTANETIVKFKDHRRAWKDAAQKSTSGFNRDIVGEARRATLDRPWIIREQQASDYAAEWGKINAQPKLGGSLTVRAEKATSIHSGDLFLLTHDALSFSIVCRCTQKTLAAPPVGQATLRFESERGIAPLPYQPTVPANDSSGLPHPERITLYQLVQAPPDISGSSDFMLTVLAARTSDYTRGLRPWLQVDDASLFYQLGEQRDNWAVLGTLTQDYNDYRPAAFTDPPDDTTEGLQITFGEGTLQADLSKISVSQSADAINDNALLVWLFSTVGYPHFEICTLISIRLDSGVYKLQVRRARFGTGKGVFYTGDTAWIVFRRDLVSYTHASFAEYAASATAATFRLQSFTPSEEADVSDTNICPDVAFTFSDPYSPVGSWTGFQKNGADLTDFTPIFLPTDTFTFSFQITDANADATEAKLVAKCGSVETTLWAGTFPESALQQRTVSFKLPVDGVYDIYIVARDATGRVSYTTMPTVSGSVAQIAIQTYGSSQVIAPAMSPTPGAKSSHSFNVTLSCATAGSTIKYQVVSLGAAAGGSWSTYVSPFSVTLDKTVYAYATHSGLTDSPVSRGDYWYEKAISGNPP